MHSLEKILSETLDKHSITSPSISNRSAPCVSALLMLLCLAPQTKHFDGCPALGVHVSSASTLKAARNTSRSALPGERDQRSIVYPPFLFRSSPRGVHSAKCVSNAWVRARGPRLMTVFTARLTVNRLYRYARGSG